MQGCFAHPSTSRLTRSLFLQPKRGKTRGTDSHYDTLELNEDASAQEIKSAYYRLSKDFHPDTTKIDKDQAAKKFQSIAEAYEVLENEESRSTYDKKMGFGSQSPNLPPFKSGDSFMERHYPGGRPDGFDPDYRTFVEFRRKWRAKQKMQRKMEAPQSFWNFDEERRQYEAHFKPKTHSWTVDDPFRREQQERWKKFEQMAKERGYYTTMKTSSKTHSKDSSPSAEDLTKRQQRKYEEEQKAKLGVTVVFGLGLAIIVLIMGGGR